MQIMNRMDKQVRPERAIRVIYNYTQQYKLHKHCVGPKRSQRYILVTYYIILFIQSSRKAKEITVLSQKRLLLADITT